MNISFLEKVSGIILSKFATTGDGILTAIKLMEAVIDAKLPLSKLAEPVKMFPQITKNLRVADKAAVREDEAVQAEVARVRELLGNDGRILLRESGTEPVVRIMVEAPTEELCEKYTQSVADVICARGLA